ncbi:MAG TPA: zinc dependent phospholipase C family protein [Nitrosospira sp.]
MHYEKTGDMIKAGINLIKNMEGASQQKAFSWLLGYTSHVIKDVTIHPVIELKVGEYQKNTDKHRICEMHQDAHILQRLNLGKVGLAEPLDSGIWGCCDKPDSGKLNPAIVILGRACSRPAIQAHTKPIFPLIDNWHGSFKFVFDKAEDGCRLPPLCTPRGGQYRVDLPGCCRS